MMASPGLKEALGSTHGYELRDNTIILVLIVMMEGRAVLTIAGLIHDCCNFHRLTHEGLITLMPALKLIGSDQQDRID